MTLNDRIGGVIMDEKSVGWLFVCRVTGRRKPTNVCRHWDLNLSSVTGRNTSLE